MDLDIDPGWISDESDFYGDAATRADLERKAQQPIEVSFVLLYGVGKTCANVESSMAPAIADSYHDRRERARDSSHHAFSRTTSNADPDDLVRVRLFKSGPGARQQSESVAEFLRRMPVSDYRTTTHDGWLWAESTILPRKQCDLLHKSNLTSFIDGGTKLLLRFEAQRSEIEKNNSGKTSAVISCIVTPHRRQLEKDILALAEKTHTTSGKWMMFPGVDDLPRFWRLVAEATVAGRLGPTSKVATFDPANSKSGTLICVYTYHFADKSDIRRVLNELVHLGLVQDGAKPIYWKADAYTYLNLNSGNRFNIRASLYSSRDLA